MQNFAPGPSEYVAPNWSIESLLATVLAATTETGTTVTTGNGFRPPVPGTLQLQEDGILITSLQQQPPAPIANYTLTDPDRKLLNSLTYRQLEYLEKMQIKWTMICSENHVKGHYGVTQLKTFVKGLKISTKNEEVKSRYAEKLRALLTDYYEYKRLAQEPIPEFMGPGPGQVVPCENTMLKKR